MKHLNLRLALGLFLIGLMACTDMVEVIEQPSSTTKDHFSLEQAIAYFKKVDLSEYLKYELDTLPEGACYPLYPGGFSLIPSKWQYENTLSEERVFVAIRARNYYAARDTMVEKTKGKCTPVCQRLMFVKSSTTGEIRMYIESILPDASYYKNRKKVTGGYINKSRSNFTAIVVVQDMLCRIQRIERYICGAQTEIIYSHTDEHNCCATMDSTTHKCSHEYNHDTINNPYDFFIHYRWKVSHLSNLRSEDIELEGTYCAFCGQLSGNCTCEASITEDYPDDGGGYGDEGGGDSDGDVGDDAGGSGGGDNTDDNDACISDDGNLANPLNNMELAPPNPANPAGATQGLTRGNGTINHTGVDFAATVGTPVYATHTGTIASTPYVDNQPNRIYDSIENCLNPPNAWTKFVKQVRSIKFGKL